jgi:integrase
MADKKKRKGRHPEKALSAKALNAFKEEGRYIDGNGLYLVVDQSGAKRWLLRTVIKGKRCDIGLGGISTVSLAQAREKAATMRSVARAGGDPLAQRRIEIRVIPTFEVAARQVHEQHAATFRNDKHKAQWISSLVEHVFPVFGGRPVDQIESADVLKALTPIWLRIPETARRVRQRMKSVFEWAKAAGYRSADNPVDGISKVLPKHNTQQKHFKALPYAEVSAFIQRVRDYEGRSTKLAFEFLILTACRTSEVLNAKWSEFDLDAKTWIIPAARMKAKREHRVPLSARCIEILEAAKNLNDGGGYVFPGGTAKKPLSYMVFHMALRHMGRTNLTPHGFRSSFRDWASEKTNFPREVCEMALAHTLQNKVEAAYNRTDLFDKRRKLMESWAAFATAPTAKVVAIRA